MGEEIKHYKIDFSKVKTVEDCIKIFKCMDMEFSQGYHRLMDIEGLIKEVDENGMMLPKKIG